MVKILSKDEVNSDALLELSDAYASNNSLALDAVRNILETAMKGNSSSSSRYKFDSEILIALSEYIDSTESFWVTSFLLQGDDLPKSVITTVQEKEALMVNSARKLEEILESWEEAKKLGYSEKQWSVLSSNVISGLSDSQQEVMTTRLAQEMDKEYKQDLISRGIEVPKGSLYYDSNAYASYDDQGESEYTFPDMKHVANSDACSFCKLFDVHDWHVSYDADRPHKDCRCTRMMVFRDEAFDYDTGWRDNFTDMVADSYIKAEENGVLISQSSLLSNLRKWDKGK